jgi:hypothetical protein
MPNKHLIWLVVLLIAVGLFASTTITRSPEKDNPVDQRAISQVEPSIKTVPHPASPTDTIAVDTQWLLEPGKQAGAITEKTTLTDLERLYGKDNIKAGEVPGPEGTTLPGAIVFPKDPKRKLTLYWKEGKGTPTPESVSVEGHHTLWHTPEGITLGMSLKTLEQLNRKPFMLSGFDWDYGGTVLSWGDEGQLKAKYHKQGNLLVRLSLPENANATLSQQVLGEETFSSQHPAMQKLNPTVSEIMIIFQ